MKMRVFDLETTGLPEDEAADICEVGYTDLLSSGEICATRWQLIDPGHPIPPELSAIHHITNEDVAGMPTSDTVVPYLTDGMTLTDIFVAHNADFERHFTPLPEYRFICTHKVAHHLYPDLKSHSNQALRYRFGLPVDREFANQAHRAGPDSHVTAHLLRAFLQFGVSIEEMLEITSRPIILRTCPLNKYYGQPWENVDEGYLEWILRTPDMKKDVVNTAKHHLELRRQRRSDPFGGNR